MKKRWWIVCVIGCLLIGMLAGCQPADDASGQEDEMDIGTDTSLIHVDLATVFTLEEMSDILGVTVTGNNVFESDTSVSFQNEEMQTVAIVAFRDCARDVFDEMVSYYDEIEETPNLGTIAYWATAGELLVYESGYAISVHVSVTDMSEDDALLISRHLAALLMERAFA